MPETVELTHKTLQAHVIKTIIGSFVTAIVGASIVGITFYYNTTNTLQAHGIDIGSIKAEEKVTSARVGAIEVNVSSIQQDNKDKADDIKEIKDELKEQSKYMIELLRNSKTMVKNQNQ